tara:strand:+ start:2098 stop:2334 length:237 start_codon:yes stop_codon:yes gene_type:complete
MYNSTTNELELILKNEARQKKLLQLHTKKLMKNYKPKNTYNKYRKNNKADYQYWKLLAVISIITNILFLLNMTLQLVN